MAHSTTKYSTAWEDPELFPDFAPWIGSVPGYPYCFRCKVCRTKPLTVRTDGVVAVRKHMKQKKHVTAMASKSAEPMRRFVLPLATGEQDVAAPAPPPPQPEEVRKDDGQPQGVQISVKKFTAHQGAERAVVRKLLWMVENHLPARHMEGCAALYQDMFYDSQVAKSFQCGKDKASYVITFGLGPHFDNLLRETVSDCKVVVCFDESWNHVTSRKQLDVHLRFWSTVDERVRFCSYLTLNKESACL
jgi:hypothetical protein